MPNFDGFDHIDVRVRSLALVEPFYDRLLPELGLVRKTFAFVDDAGEWHAPDAEHPYNTVEYHEAPRPGCAGNFIGFIEDRAMTPLATRIALRVPSKRMVRDYELRLRGMGALQIELDQAFDDYPAVFFEDPAGTRLELCARNPKLPAGDRILNLIPYAHVADVRRSIAFYRSLGFELERSHSREETIYWAALRAGDARLFLARASEPVDAAAQAVLYYLWTENAVALRERLSDAGIGISEVTYPDYMPCGELRLSDPDGYVLLIGQPESAPPA